ncbi:E3 ubiquitin-protein ligase TRIM56-like [Apostichopus japonicus]|uniref:E3 ubiquitin-protein ligase TRIM56-like n=1 Tax=Stichopus japonicus TaxID=307972 RepID=UPI003AB1C275
MASSNLLEKIGDFLECTICLDNYRRPKVLQCLHTFCEECLFKIAPRGTNKVLCPTCREETNLEQEGVSNLRNNFVFSNLLDLVTSIQKPLDDHPTNVTAAGNHSQYGCTNCESGANAATRCLNCCEFLCLDCTDAHRRIKAIRHHVMRDIEDWLAAGRHIIEADKAEKRSQKTNFCPNHEEEIVVVVYCEACEQSLCEECSQHDHAKSPHRIVPMKDAAERGRQQIKNVLSECKRKLCVFSTAIEATVQIAKDLQRRSDRAQKDLQQTAKEYTLRIQKEQSELMALLHKRREVKEGEMAAHINSLQRAVDVLRGMCSLAETALGDDASAVDVLRSKVKLSGERRVLNQVAIVNVPSDLSALKFERNHHFRFPPDYVLGKISE